MGSSCKKEKMRRFSDEQIRRLEVMFESDTKLEPKKKDEVAKELGLQPRQVAIWFQNRRARCKSKQLEIDYNLLLSRYNTLSSQFDSLQKQHHALLAQLEKLKSREKVGVKTEEENQCNIDQLETCTGGGGNSSSSTSGSSSSDEESDYMTKMEYDQLVLKYIIPDSSTKEEALDILQGMDDENDPLFKTVVDSLLTTSSAEDWGTSLDSDDLIYQPTTNDTDTYQWLDFWG